MLCLRTQCQTHRQPQVWLLHLLMQELCYYLYTHDPKVWQTQSFHGLLYHT